MTATGSTIVPLPTVSAVYHAILRTERNRQVEWEGRAIGSTPFATRRSTHRPRSNTLSSGETRNAPLAHGDVAHRTVGHEPSADLTPCPMAAIPHTDLRTMRGTLAGSVKRYGFYVTTQPIAPLRILVRTMGFGYYPSTPRSKDREDG